MNASCNPISHIEVAHLNGKSQFIYTYHMGICEAQIKQIVYMFFCPAATVANIKTTVLPTYTPVSVLP